MSVRQSLLSRKSFRGDQKKSGGGLADPKDFDQLGRVDIGDKVHLQVAPSEGLEGLRDHNRPEVGTSDPDVDDVGDWLALIAFPRSGANLLGKNLHVLAGGLYLRHHVLTVDEQGLVSGAAKGDVKDRAIFGTVDLIATKHSISELFHFGFLEKLAKEFESFWGDAVFGVINEEIVPAMG